MVAVFLTLKGAASLIFFFLIGSGCLYSLVLDHTQLLRPAGLRGKTCHSSECILNLYEMSPPWVLRRAPKVDDLWIAIHCAWSYAVVLPDLRKKSRKNVWSTVLTAYGFGCCLAETITCVYSAGQNISVTQFTLDSCMCTVNLHPGMTCFYMFLHYCNASLYRKLKEAI